MISKMHKGRNKQVDLLLVKRPKRVARKISHNARLGRACCVAAAIVGNVDESTQWGMFR
jgi:hypothetical protein